MKRLPMLILLTLVLPSCASIVNGRTQEIEVRTTPAGAQCRLLQDGVAVGQITSPDRVTVETRKHDIFIECQKRGYQKATYVNKSGLNTWVYGNVVTLGVGYGVDALSGAHNRYEERVELTLAGDGRTAGGDQSAGGGTAPATRSGGGFPAIGTSSQTPSYPRQGQPQASYYATPPSSTAAMMAGPTPNLGQPRGALVASPPQTPGPAGGATYGVLFASYDSAAQARQGWNQIWNSYWSVLSGVQPYIEYGTVGSSANRYNLYGKTATKDQASRLCQGIRRSGASCAVVYF